MLFPKRRPWFQPQLVRLVSTLWICKCYFCALAASESRILTKISSIPSSAPTEFFTQDQTTTRWIGVNTVNVETITITNGATIVTTTEPAPVAMITASAAGGDGTEVGE